MMRPGPGLLAFVELFLLALALWAILRALGGDDETRRSRRRAERYFALCRRCWRVAHAVQRLAVHFEDQYFQEIER